MVSCVACSAKIVLHVVGCEVCNIHQECHVMFVQYICTSLMSCEICPESGDVICISSRLW